MQRTIIKKIIRRASVIGLIILALFIIGRIFIFSVFNITSGSMYPLMSAGDKVVVLKPIYGARIINLYNLFSNDSISYWNLPGIRKVKRNDVIVFNYPYKEWNTWDTIEFQHRKYYVKRCIGLPGDSLWIVGGLYHISGINENIGDCYAQNSLKNYRNLKVNIDSVIPYSNKWTIYDMGPLYIPQKGDIIPIDSSNYSQYKTIIEWESNKSLFLDNNHIRLGQEKINKYCFNHNYYFMGGDNVLESVDSRYWGLLPEPFILGNVKLVLKSTTKIFSLSSIKLITQ